MVCAMCYSGGVLWHGTELNVGDIISIWLGSIWYVICMVCPGTIWYVSGRLCLGTICMLVVWYVFVQYGIGMLVVWYGLVQYAGGMSYTWQKCAVRSKSARLQRAMIVAVWFPTFRYLTSFWTWGSNK